MRRDQRGRNTGAGGAGALIARRAALTAMLGGCCGLTPGLARAQVPPEGVRARPQPGDLLVKTSGEERRPLTPDDVPLGETQIMAWPFDLAADIVRSGSRLNKVLLLRLDPAGFDPETCGPRPVEDYTHGYHMSLAPLVADSKVMVGCSGGELGVRGFVAAFDAETGKPLWKTFTVPAPSEPGSETWPVGDQWKTGGGSVWVTGNYDPETNLAFWGTGNGGPWMGDQRPGDNLYTSMLALDATTGAIKGYHQYHPNDSWDWDEVSPPILVDYRHGGRTVRGLVDVARDGYLWMLERTVDKINFVAGQPYVKQNVFASLDPKTGRPNVDPARQPGTGKKADFCPSLWGGKNWPPAAYSPKTRFLYIRANDNLCCTSIGEKVDYSRGERYVGATTTLYIAPDADHIGELQAWNLDTGKKVWSHPFVDSENWAPVLATGGGVLFAGGTNDRYFRAFDAATGKTLSQFRTGSGVVGVPSSFAIDGKQYIAVQSGWGVDAARTQARINLVRPHQYPDVPQGGAIWVCALE